MKRTSDDAGPKAAASQDDRFRQSVLCHADLVFRVALRMSGRPSDAEDLTQETFLRAHRAFDRFDLREHGAKAWLLKILHNVAVTRRARDSRQPTLLEDVNFDNFAAELERDPLPRLADGQMTWEHFDDELKQAVEGLIPEYRDVLLLWALGDLSYKQIADILAVPMGTVMSRLYRARHLLGQELAGYAARRGVGAGRRPS
jgi:RNA polymerase sigma-70 factor (ECF subfamily)